MKNAWLIRDNFSLSMINSPDLFSLLMLYNTEIAIISYECVPLTSSPNNSIPTIITTITMISHSRIPFTHSHLIPRIAMQTSHWEPLRLALTPAPLKTTTGKGTSTLRSPNYMITSRPGSQDSAKIPIGYHKRNRCWKHQEWRRICWQQNVKRTLLSDREDL